MEDRRGLPRGPSKDLPCILHHAALFRLTFAQGRRQILALPYLTLSLPSMSPSPVVPKAQRHKARTSHPRLPSRQGDDGVSRALPRAQKERVEGSLQVVSLGGLLCTVSVDMAATVEEAQKVIAKTAGIPVREQQLISQNRPLCAREVLGDVLGKEDEVTLVRCDAKAMAIKSAMRTGSLALERARRLTMQCTSNA